jgi:GNAT superfamily N-acetyltransferase
MTPGELARRPHAGEEAGLAEIRRREIPGTGVFRQGGRRFRYTLRVLAPEHVEDVWRLQQKVLEPLTPPLPLYVRDREFFHRCMAELGSVVGAFHRDRLVAYATLHAPGVSGENLGTDIGLSRRELPFVAHLAGSAVDPAYRGNHLQSVLVDLRETFAREAGFRHLCGEVIPGNAVSIRNHLAVGYYLKAFRIDRLGDPNFVLDKELRGPRPLLPVTLTESRVDDIDGFRAMMRDGRWGFRTGERDGTTSIIFGCFA